MFFCCFFFKFKAFMFMCSLMEAMTSSLCSICFEAILGENEQNMQWGKRNLQVPRERINWQYNGCFPFPLVWSSRWLQAIYYPPFTPTIATHINGGPLQKQANLQSYCYLWNEIILSGMSASLLFFTFSRQWEALTDTVWRREELRHPRKCHFSAITLK